MYVHVKNMYIAFQAQVKTTLNTQVKVKTGLDSLTLPIGILSWQMILISVCLKFWYYDCFKQHRVDIYSFDRNLIYRFTY